MICIYNYETLEIYGIRYNWSKIELVEPNFFLNDNRITHLEMKFYGFISFGSKVIREKPLYL